MLLDLLRPQVPALFGNTDWVTICPGRLFLLWLTCSISRLGNHLSRGHHGICVTATTWIFFVHERVPTLFDNTDWVTICPGGCLPVWLTCLICRLGNHLSRAHYGIWSRSHCGITCSGKQHRLNDQTIDSPHGVNSVAMWLCHFHHHQKKCRHQIVFLDLVRVHRVMLATSIMKSRSARYADWVTICPGGISDRSTRSGKQHRLNDQTTVLQHGVTFVAMWLHHLHHTRNSSGTRLCSWTFFVHRYLPCLVIPTG